MKDALWELVTFEVLEYDDNGRTVSCEVRTHRLAVPGGWLYRVLPLGADGLSAVFVPDPVAIMQLGVDTGRQYLEQVKALGVPPPAPPPVRRHRRTRGPS